MNHALAHPRSADGLVPGAGLAVLVHGLLIGALALGVDWRQQPLETVSAELWAALPEVAAPRVPEVVPPAPPPPAAVAPPPPAPTPAPPPAPDIALEKQRDRQLAQAKKAEAEAERQRQAAADKAQAQKLAQQKAQDKARAEAQVKAEALAEEARLEAQRQENLKRLLAQAGGSGAPGSTGGASRDAAPSAAYSDLLRVHIRGKIVGEVDRLPASLATLVEIRSTTSGTVLSRRLIKGSGNAAWDAMVMRGVQATDTLPRDETGRVPPVLEITFRPHQR